MTFVSGPPKQVAALVRAQFRAPAVSIAREIVIQKIIQYRASGWLTAPQAKDAKSALRHAQTVPDIMFHSRLAPIG